MQNKEQLATLRTRLSSLLVEDAAKGDYRLRREIYTDPDLFELEIRHIFEGNWAFVAHDSQLPKPHDFFTTTIGRQPVVVSRDADGRLACFLNACAHRGAVVVRKKTGNRKSHTCGFHGWTYDSRGALRGIADEERGQYPATLDYSTLGLKQIRVESYRGFIFASINPDVVSLDAYLGDAKIFINMVVDSSPHGEMEVLQGTGIYTYKGNWKLSTENGIDGYHGLPVHGSYIELTMRRMKGASGTQVKVSDLSRLAEIPGGFHVFENGHGLLWTDYINWKVRPGASDYERYVSEFGAVRADWMVKRIRNLLLAPNVFLMDSMSQQIRVVRPLAVDKTEVTIYAMAPVGESDPARENRLRQYEDFYNASGLATPDDVTEFTNCQKGFAAAGLPWSDLSRGAGHCVRGSAEDGRTLGFSAAWSGETESGNEGLYVAMYRDWIARLERGIDQSLKAPA